MTAPQESFKFDDLHRRIHEIDEASPELRAKRAELLEGLRNDRGSPISVLPPELLGLIFQFARPSGFTDQDAQETVSFCDLKSVSKQWHEVLMSNPVIWTEVDLRITGVEQAGEDAKLLIPFIMRSGQLPLSLGIHYPFHFRPDATTLIHPSIDELLLLNLPRITHLRLISPPLAWLRKPSLLQQITHLTLYDVNSSAPPRLSLDQTVSLTVRSSPYLELASAAKVTTLKLISVRITISLDLIISCPNLKKLYLSARANDGLFAGSLNDFTIPHLQVFYWNITIHHLDYWYKVILGRISLPSLRTLEWEERDIMDYQTAGEAISIFFSRLPTTLTTLKFRLMLSTAKWSRGATEDGYHLPPVGCNLESIEFIECSIRFFLLFLQNLRTGLKFPRLHTIRTEKIQWTPEYWVKMRGEVFRRQMEEVSQACLTMLRNRMDVVHTSFTLILEERDMGWWDKVQQGLGELRPGGCEMEIHQTGYRIVLKT